MINIPFAGAGADLPPPPNRSSKFEGGITEPGQLNLGMALIAVYKEKKIICNENFEDNNMYCS
jgi:hypothetical protein